MQLASACAGEGGAISAWKVDISEGVLLIQHCRAEALKGGGGLVGTERSSIGSNML